MGSENKFENGTIDEAGNTVFKGELITKIGKIAYNVTGTLVDGVINATAKTKMGDISIQSK